MKKIHVDGAKKCKLMLYALSTCVWCKKTKQMLNDLGVEYDYVFVDQLEGDDLKEAEKELRKWNPAQNFPTLVVDSKDCIIGYQPEEIQKRIG